MDTSAHEGKAFCAASTAAVISAWVAHGTRVTTSFVACRGMCEPHSESLGAARTTHRVVDVYPLGRGAIHKFAANEQLRGGLSGGKRGSGRGLSRTCTLAPSARQLIQHTARAKTGGCTLSPPSSLHNAAQTTHRLRAVRPQRHTATANRTLANDARRETPTRQTLNASDDYLQCTHQKVTYSALPRKMQLTLLFRILLSAAILTHVTTRPRACASLVDNIYARCPIEGAGDTFSDLGPNSMGFCSF